MLAAFIPRGKSGLGEAVLRPRGRSTRLGLGSVIKCVLLARAEPAELLVLPAQGRAQPGAHSAWRFPQLSKIREKPVGITAPAATHPQHSQDERDEHDP